MKLLFKQKFFSWFDSYDIYNELGDVVYTVKGEISWGHCLQIYDAAGNHLGTVKEKVLTFLPVFDLFEGENHIGKVKKELTFFTPKFYLDYRDWQVMGDILEWNYEVTERSGAKVAGVEKKIWNWTDTYEIDIARPDDGLSVLMIVLAIDAAKCSQGS